ncbi:MAG: PSD1 and planctomycete cytochrome C domain-containing protein [Gemmataceae bacterium]
MRIALALLLLSPWVARAAEPVDYRKQIRPVLQERCYACHGALKQNSKLRVDSGKAMIDRGAVVPGKPADSELLARITAKDDETRMPPEGHPLKPGEIETIRQWIEQGAKVPADDAPEPDPRDHWSFRTPVRPPVPGTGNPIDAFVAAKWKEKGLAPVLPADKRILLRRVCLDLTGLPPTHEQTEAFLKDTSPNAYEKVVDALLASPQYGERWGRHFLDVWRYSDWWGLGAELRNSQKHIWHWRDWTVENLNADTGYHEMLRQMLAADELYPTDAKKLRATGFLARPYFLFNRTTWLDEVVEHTGKGFLGLTFNCTKCHDHKYDPISQTNYYQLRAVFEPYQVRTDYVGGELDPEKGGLPRVFDCNLDAKTFFHIRGDERTPDKNREIVPNLPGFLAPNGLKIEPVKLPVAAYEPGMKSEIIAAHRAAASQKLASATADVAKAKLALTEAERLAALKDKEQPAEPKKAAADGKVLFSDDFSKPNPDAWERGPGEWKHEKGKLLQQKADGDRSHLRSKKDSPADLHARFNFTITGGVPYRSVGVAFDVHAENEVLVYVSAADGAPKLQIAYKQGGNYVYPPAGALATPIPLNKPIDLAIRVRGSLVNVALDGKHVLAYDLPLPRKPGKIDLITYTATAAFNSFELRELPKDAVFFAPGGKPAAPAALTLDKAKAALATAETALKSAKAEMEKVEKAEKNPNDPAVALRGAMKAKENNLEADATRLKPFPQTSTGRRTALANWIADPSNPLTARVAVNHVWLRHFGQPLVPTVFDFGRKGTPPTHPELLDWLAVELMENKWSLKHLHKLIVTSHTYRLSSSSLNGEENIKKDEANRYLWRMNPQRMQAQAVRDSLLHLAGDLDLTLGGPTVPMAEQDSSRRRAMYFFHSHNEHHKFLDIFDDANVLECYRRSESIVPQQGLALWNSKFAIGMAAKINDKLHARLGEVDDAKFVSAAFEFVLGTSPTKDELAVSVEALSELRTSLKDAKDAGKRARAQLVQALVNHNDFVTVR